MKCYRLKHKSTGLYFTPSRDVRCKLPGCALLYKSNLSKKGKVYTTRPSFKWVINGFYNHVASSELDRQKIKESSSASMYQYYGSSHGKVWPSNINDWEIEEVN